MRIMTKEEMHAVSGATVTDCAVIALTVAGGGVAVAAARAGYLAAGVAAEGALDVALIEGGMASYTALDGAAAALAAARFNYTANLATAAIAVAGSVLSTVTGCVDTVSDAVDWLGEQSEGFFDDIGWSSIDLNWLSSDWGSRIGHVEIIYDGYSIGSYDYEYDWDDWAY